jgi:sugar/nucleoside kinase (ribokinase family)
VADRYGLRMDRTPEVVCMGHAIVDVLAFSPDDLVTRLGLEKGTMALVEDADAARIYDALGPASEVSGGSAANTAASLASLGAAVEFIGKVRADTLGEVFSHDIQAAGVRFVVPPEPAPIGDNGPGTGRSLVLVTPDAEKTMCTSLGIGAALVPADLDEEAIAAARVLYVEGYLYGSRPTDAAVERAVSVARAAGTAVALSLSDPAWVQFQRRALDGLLNEVDILFANEHEASLMAELEDVEAAVKALNERCSTVVVTCGAQGSVVARDGIVVSVPAARVATVVDTTGAGDSFAAGFLFGLVRGNEPEQCARLGALAAAEVVSHLGARPQASLAELAESAGL